MTIRFVAVLLVLAVAVATLLRAARRRRGAVADPRVIRRTAFGFEVVTTVSIGTFIIGETFSDPGGWNAVGLTVL